MKVKEEVKTFRDLNKEELLDRVEKSKQELMNLRFRKVSGQLTNSAQIKMLKRSIARANTLILEKVLVSG